MPSTPPSHSLPSPASPDAPPVDHTQQEATHPTSTITSGTTATLMQIVHDSTSWRGSEGATFRLHSESSSGPHFDTNADTSKPSGKLVPGSSGTQNALFFSEVRYDEHLMRILDNLFHAVDVILTGKPHASALLALQTGVYSGSALWETFAGVVDGRHQKNVGQWSIKLERKGLPPVDSWEGRAAFEDGVAAAQRRVEEIPHAPSEWVYVTAEEIMTGTGHSLKLTLRPKDGTLSDVPANTLEEVNAHLAWTANKGSTNSCSMTRLSYT
ncbi:hypothetical protein IAT38_007411 [Cryptococcus sp. DSM 104549]